MKRTFLSPLTLWFACGIAYAQPTAQPAEPAAIDPAPAESTTPGDPPETTRDAAPPQDLNEALQRLNLPGIKISVEEWSVDVEATVSLRHGLLELIACVKDTKEHESIVAVNAKPSHIHAALLLIGANPGNPAVRKIVGEGDDARFIELPPRGDLVDVYLVINSEDGPQQHPISDFIEMARDDFDHLGNPVTYDDEPDPFPGHSFLFTGSVLVERGEGEPRQYIADYSGNVITLVTFGDEMMSKPGFHDDANHALMWQVKNTKLPELDSAVTLRFKPQRGKAATE